MNRVRNRRAWTKTGLAATLPIFLYSCLTSEFVPINYYVVNPNIEKITAAPSSLSLGIHPLGYARLYAKKMVSYTSQYKIGFDNNQQWAELPRDFVTRALLDGLRQTHRFADVSYAADISRPDLILTGELRHFDQLRTPQGPWTAHCAVRLELRERFTDIVLWADTIEAEAEHPSNDAQGFSAAMSQALAQVVDQATRELIKAGKKDSG